MLALSFNPAPKLTHKNKTLEFSVGADYVESESTDVD